METKTYEVVKDFNFEGKGGFITGDTIELTEVEAKPLLDEGTIKVPGEETVNDSEVEEQKAGPATHIMTNKESGEEKRVLLHTDIPATDTTPVLQDFAEEGVLTKDWMDGNVILYRFENVDGELSGNDEWDIYPIEA